MSTEAQQYVAFVVMYLFIVYALNSSPLAGAIAGGFAFFAVGRNGSQS